MDTKGVLGLIPARGGSKAVHRKNIHLLNNKPLIAYTIETALNCGAFDRVVVSTDSEEIADVARQYGASVPFIRPAALAQDDTPDLPVYQHCIQWLEEHENFSPEIIAWLRPTAPLRSGTDISNAIAMLREKKTDWVRSVCEAEHHPYWMYKLTDGHMSGFIDGIDLKQYYRRQLLPPVYRLNGAVDVTWRTTIMDKQLLYTGTMCGYVMPHDRSIDIDSILDFAIAEQYLRNA